ncbi:expressed unknown protein [Seminavis robusta]|uniref:Uncharacterized protein n=1 Tax=Seminavis robusta TaxID=568900 RepID=A0A9N8EB84_9STRA|nr:expressed unknown protein [Seminavis robusta]|eukprot:Sro711_g191190.1 n/a (209) ;mRNA; r:24638-25264
MDFMQRTAELNHQGVNYLSAAHQAPVTHSEALSCFKSALSILSAACDDGSASTGTRNGAQPLRINIYKSNPVVLSPSNTHRHAFYMTCGEAAQSYEACSAESAVLLFNLALGLHQKGSWLRDEMCLHRASLLYEHSLELLSAVGNCFAHAEEVTVEALKNLADIYSKIGNESGLRCVLDALVLLNVRRVIHQQDLVSPPGNEWPAAAA